MQYHFANPEPYAHQVEALQKMLATKGRTALLMEPGTGKTRSVIDYLSLLATAKRGPIRTLVVAPVAALDTWIEQAGQYAPDETTPNPVGVFGEVLEGSIEERAARLASFGPGPADEWPGADPTVEEHVNRPAASPAMIQLAVTNLEAFSRRHPAKGADGEPLATVTVLDRMVAAVKSWAPDVLVIDESHRIKSTTSNMSLAMMRLSKIIDRRLLLTGTVMPHSPMDVYAQWRAMAPEAFSGSNGRPWNAARWREEYARMGGWQGKEIVGWRNLDDMEARMARNAIVVKKADALDLPPTTDATVRVHLSSRERNAYDRMKRDLALRIEGETAVAQNVLVQILRLRQITSGHLPTDDGAIREIGDSKARVVAGLAEDLLATEQRLVVFAHFVADVHGIADRLRRSRSMPADLTVEVITGETPTSERTAIRRRFGNVEANPGPVVLVAQMRTMSLAVNELVTASHAIYASMSERRDDYVQSRDRLDRIGQTKPVTFWHVVAPGTIDEVMLRAHRERTDIESSLLAHVRGEAAPEPTEEEVAAKDAEDEQRFLERAAMHDAIAMFRS